MRRLLELQAVVLPAVVLPVVVIAIRLLPVLLVNPIIVKCVKYVQVLEIAKLVKVKAIFTTHMIGEKQFYALIVNQITMANVLHVMEQVINDKFPS